MKREPFQIGQEVLLRAQFAGEAHHAAQRFIFDLGDVRVGIDQTAIEQLLAPPPAPAGLDALERAALEELIKYRTHPESVNYQLGSWAAMLRPMICAVDEVLEARKPQSLSQKLAEAWERYSPNAEDGSELTEPLEEAILAAVQALEKQEKS